MRRIAFWHMVSAFGLLAVLVAASAYLYGGVLNKSLLSGPVVVSATLEETGGLFEASKVTYRGVDVGSVRSIRIDQQGVVVQFELTGDHRVPADVIASVRSLSPAGEQFLDLQPRSAGPPYLADGASIDASATVTPTSVAEALSSVDRLMSKVDEDDLRTVIRELAEAFAQPDDLGQLLTEGQQLISTIDRTWPAIERILDNGGTVLQAGNDLRNEFAAFAASSRDLAAWLREYDPKLRSLLADSPSKIADTNQLMDEISAAMPPVLDNAVTLADLVAARDPHLRELLVQFPIGAARLADTLRNGRFHVNLLIEPGSVCSYDRDLGQPTSTNRQPLNRGGVCAASFSAQQRGAAHAPPPTR